MEQVDLLKYRYHREYQKMLKYVRELKKEGQRVSPLDYYALGHLYKQAYETRAN